MTKEDTNERIVYVLNNRPTIFINRLRELGFEVLVGDGKLNEEMLANCWAFWSGRTVVTEEFLKKAPKLKLICKQGVGVERIDLDACTRYGVCVANTPKSNYISVAEHTMSLLLSAAKNMVPIFLQYRTEGSQYSFGDNCIASDIFGKTLSIIGLGRIGQRVAELAHAFGMEIIAYDMFRRQEDVPEYITLAPTMEEAIRQADYLTLHVSGTEENRGMIGSREFKLMKPSAVLINTTRGFVVDEGALYETLKRRQIAGAALDVFCDDPLKPDNPLLALDNVVATPHTAANTREARERASIECVKIVTDFASGRKPESARN